MRPAPENGELRQRDLTERERKTRRKNKKKIKNCQSFYSTGLFLDSGRNQKYITDSITDSNRCKTMKTFGVRLELGFA